MNELSAIAGHLFIAFIIGSLMGGAMGYAFGFNATFDYWENRLRREEKDKKSE